MGEFTVKSTSVNTETEPTFINNRMFKNDAINIDKEY